MKKIFSILSVGLLALGISSCSDSDQQEPWIVSFPHVVLDGNTTEIVPVGDNWTLPGFQAYSNTTGADMSANVDVYIYDVINDTYVGNITTNEMGYYIVTYRGYSDNHIGSTDDQYYVDTEREVFVYDPSVTASIEGSYNVNMAESYYNGGMNFTYWAGYFGNVAKVTGITFTELVPGFFYCNDLFAGWYAQIRGYSASSYSMTGYVALTPQNEIVLLSSYVAGWGDGLDGMWDGFYDPDTKTISYYIEYAGQLSFDIVLQEAE